jgi:UDP-3-O-[3-hydroxymyristoyl] glucosamine N-acyltransferase
MLGAQSGYMSDVPSGQRWMGSPAQPLRDYMKSVALLRKVARGAGKGRRG